MTGCDSRSGCHCRAQGKPPPAHLVLSRWRRTGCPSLRPWPQAHSALHLLPAQRLLCQERLGRWRGCEGRPYGSVAPGPFPGRSGIPETMWSPENQPLSINQRSSRQSPGSRVCTRTQVLWQRPRWSPQPRELLLCLGPACTLCSANVSSCSFLLTQKGQRESAQRCQEQKQTIEGHRRGVSVLNPRHVGHQFTRPPKLGLAPSLPLATLLRDQRAPIHRCPSVSGRPSWVRKAHTGGWVGGGFSSAGDLPPQSACDG